MSFFRALIDTFFSRGFYVITTIATGIIIARTCGPEGKGIYSLLLLIPSTLVAIGSIGLNEGNIYFASREKHQQSSLYNTAMLAQSVLAIILVALFYLYLAIWKHNPWSDLQPAAIHLALFSTIIFLFYMIANNLLFALDSIRERNQMENIRSFGTLAMQILLGLALGWTVFNFFLSWTIVLTLTTIAFLFICARKIPQKQPPTKENFNKILGYGMKGYLGRLFSFFNHRLSILLVKTFMNNAQVGLFNTAIGLAELQFHLVAAAQLVFFPKVASHTTKQEGYEFSAKITRHIIFLLLPMAILILWLAVPIIKLTYGVAFLECYPSLKILVPGIFILGITNILSSALAGTGNPEIESYIVIPTVILKLALFIVLIPQFGLIGAAWATTLGYLIQAIITIIIFQRKSQLPIAQLLLITRNDLRNLISRLQK